MRKGRGGGSAASRRQVLWVSLDLAAVSGYAVWLGNELLYCGEVSKAPRRKGAWQDVRYYPGVADPVFHEHKGGERAAWENIVDSLYGQEPKYFVVESAHVGPNRLTIIKLAQRHGRVQVYLGDEANKRWQTVEPAKWRKASKDLVGGSWPKGRDAKKEAAQRAVAKAFKVDGGADIADAVLIGRWFMGTESLG